MSMKPDENIPVPNESQPHGPPPASPVPWKVVYTIVDRGKGRRVWLRVGVAFINRDQSLNVRLDAVPINGQLHIREAPAPGTQPSDPPPDLDGSHG